MDGYTDLIRVDARDLRPGDRIITAATCPPRPSMSGRFGRRFVRRH